MQYNKYKVDHSQVSGELRLLNVPTNILEVPKNILPAEVAKPQFPSILITNPEFPPFVIGTQVIVAFTSNLPRTEANARKLLEAQTLKKKGYNQFYC